MKTQVLEIDSKELNVLLDVITYAKKKRIEIKSVFMPPYKEGTIFGVKLVPKSVMLPGITQEVFKKQQWGAGMVVRYEDNTQDTHVVIEAPVVSVNFDDETIGIEFDGYKNPSTEDILFLHRSKCTLIQDFVPNFTIQSSICRNVIDTSSVAQQNDVVYIEDTTIAHNFVASGATVVENTISDTDKEWEELVIPKTYKCGKGTYTGTAPCAKCVEIGV